MEDVFDVLKQLGPNKVTQPFEEDAAFVQAVISTSSTSCLDPYSLFPVPSVSSVPFSGSMKKPQIQSKVQSQTETTSPIPSKNAFITTVMTTLNPLVSVLTDQEDTLTKFKRELTKNLTNERQLFKKLGFSRKKGVTIESMEKEIEELSHTRFGLPSEYILQYIAHLLKANLAIINERTTERIDIIVTEDNRWRLIEQCDTNGYSFSTGGTGEVMSKEDVDEFASTIMRRAFSGDIDSLKIADLRSWARFTMGAVPKGATKAILGEEMKRRLIV